MSALRNILAAALLIFASSMLLVACADTVAGCQSNDDCRSGRLCVANVCVDGNLPPLDMSTPDDDMASDMDTPDIPDPSDMAVDQGPLDMTIDVGVDSGNMDMGMDSGNMDMGMDSGNMDMGMDSGNMDMGMDSGNMDMGMDSGNMDMGMDSGDMDMGIIGPRIEVTPTQIDFGGVVVNATANAIIQVRNVGDANLIMTNAGLGSSPSQAFFVMAPTVAVTIAPGASETLYVAFTPTIQANFRNTVQIDSNDPNSPITQVDLSGRGRNTTNQSCFFASPDNVDFGVVTPGTSGSTTVTIGNCSTSQTVTVTQASISGAATGPFSFTTTQPTPFTLAAGTTQNVVVNFAPSGLPSVAEQLEFRTDAQIGTSEVVDLFGSGGGCIDPVARAESRTDVTDRLRSTPILITRPDTVVLDASDTTTPSGQITPVWTVKSAPAGSTATPSTTSFQPDVVGAYELELNVTDPVTMAPSCAPTSLKVVAIQHLPRVRASLTWSAPHDLDLHFVRDDGNNNFNLFDPLNDTHYDNLNPDWGTANVATDDAFHHGDDTDGFGPEMADLAELEPGRKYRAIVQFGRRQGFNPPQFSATLTLTVAPNFQLPMLRTLTHTFQIQQIGTYWITFEVNGTTAAITQIDTTM